MRMISMIIENQNYLECRNHKTTQYNVLNLSGTTGQMVAVHIGGKVLIDDLLSVKFRKIILKLQQLKIDFMMRLVHFII